MHGYGLHFLLNPSERGNAGTLAFSRPLKNANNDDEYEAVKHTNDINAI
jgi:hypothetical protein